MLLDLFAREKRKVAAILDVGSGAVSGALVLIGKNRAGGEVEAIAHAHTELFNAGESFERFSRSVADGIRRVLGELSACGLPPAELHCFLASPFLISQTRLVNYREEPPKLISEKTYQALVRKAAEEFVNEQKIEHENFYLLENKILRVALNGHEIPDPIGHKAGEVSIAQYLSGAPGSIIKFLAKAISGPMHNDKISFHSYSLAAFSALRDYLQLNDFMAVDVSGELTDVLVAKNSVLLENISFPYGLKRIKEQLAALLNSWPEGIETELNLLLRGQLHGKAAARLEKAVAVVREEWLGKFEQALSLAMETAMMPKHIVLTGETGLNKLFLSWIKTDGRLKRYTLQSGDLDAYYIDHAKISATIGANRSLRDTYLLLESYYYEKLMRAK